MHFISLVIHQTPRFDSKIVLIISVHLTAWFLLCLLHSRFNQDSDLSKLLFNKDLPRIQGLVDNYYDAIFHRQRVSQQELNRELAQTCENFTGLFSKLSTLQQLWDFVKKYNQKVVEACEEDEACQQQQLAYKLVEVETILSNQDCDAEAPV
jgi:hypothetical protein